MDSYLKASFPGHLFLEKKCILHNEAESASCHWIAIAARGQYYIYRGWNYEAVPLRGVHIYNILFTII